MPNKIFNIVKSFACVFFIVIKLNSQNLISNSSFAEIIDSSANSIPYKINLFGKSNVKDWYMLNVKSNREIPIYYTARDVEYYNSTRNYTYSEHMLYKNNGFIKLNVNAFTKSSIIQQKFINPIDSGTYCFTFKYKVTRSYGQHISFAFTKTNLSEYISKGKKVPNNQINFNFIDSTSVQDENVEWQYVSKILYLKGDEEYLTIGDLNPIPYKFSEYFIDDISLTKLKNNELCIQKNESPIFTNYKRSFEINKMIFNDSLTVFTPLNTRTPFFITPQAKQYLNQIIAFLQKNQDLKICIYEVSLYSYQHIVPQSANHYWTYMRFYGISRDRILTKRLPCQLYKKYDDECDINKEYERIGIEFIRN